MRSRRAVLVLVLEMLATACSNRTRGSGGSTPQTPAPAHVTLAITGMT